MSDILINWLNNEIKLSKKITDIPKDFRTGYYFAELLNKVNHLPVMSSYKNTMNQIDIIHNLHYLQKNLQDLGISLNEQCKDKILNADIYTAKIYLYKIKRLLESKNINLEQLYFKNSISLSKMYNSIYYKNDNEKYIKNVDRKTILNSGINNYKYIRKYEPDKYKIGGELYKEIKKEYAHLELNDFDMKLILDDIKDTEFKIKYLKNYVLKSEEKQKRINKTKEEKEINLWNNSLNGINSLKHKILNKSLNKVKKNINCFKSHMNENNIYLKTNTLDFEDKLNLYQKQSTNKSIEDENEEYELDEEALKEKNRKEYKISQVALANIRKKLDENIKNKKDKEKRERQKLKDENIYINNLNQNINYKESEKNNVLNYMNTDINRLEINNKKENMNKTIENNLSSKNSTYSNLTKSDYCANLIKNSFSIHRPTIQIGNRINFFKTIINSNLKPEKILPEIKLKKEENKKVMIERFNSEEYFNALNKENYETHKKNLEKKKSKKNKQKALIKPIIEQILEITNSIFDSNKSNNFELVNDKIWKELTDKLISNELLNKSNEEIIIIKKEEKSVDNNKEDIQKENFENDKNEENENQKAKYIDINALYEDLFNDYVNYTGLFNDIIIPHEIRGKKYTYIDLYSELYDYYKNKVDIKDYEPVEEEIENLYLPKYINGKNIHFYDILTEIIEYQNNPVNNSDGNINNLKNDLKKINIDNNQEINSFKNIIKKKGKYFYLPIKMAFVGYPLSGKKTQSKLLQNLYPNIKIYEPELILKNKISEYKDLYEDTENNPKIKAMKPNQIEQYKKEIEEKKEKFKQDFEIIKPYIDYIQKKKEILENIEDKVNKENKENKGKKERKESKENKKRESKVRKESKENKDNSEENKNISKQKSNENINKLKTIEENNNDEESEIKSQIYMQLLLNEISKDFNENDEEILNQLTSNKNNYSNYCQTLKKIKEIKEKLDNISKEAKEAQDAKDKKSTRKDINAGQNNLMKELDILNKELISIKSSLCFGFIIINFPKSEKDALKLENYFTGFQLEYQKPKNAIEEKLISYDIINFNLEKKNLNKGIPLISFLDLYINFEINSNEVDKRYSNIKYDPTTGKIYTLEEIANINDKKLLERLEKGMPDLDEKEIDKMKINHDKNIYEISKLYKKMNNGIDSIFLNLDQSDNDKKYLKELNPNLESSIEDIIFKYFYKNIDEIISTINENIKLKEKDKINNENDSKANEEIKEIINQQQSKDLNINKEVEKLNNLNNIVSKNTYTIYKEMISDLDYFYPNYKLTIKTLIYFMSKQRKEIILYLNNIQNEFIEYLNRKSEKNDIIEMYIQKYNNLFKMHPELKNNKGANEDLMNDIANVNNSIWVKVQTKKIENIKYLENIKTNGEKEKKIIKFIEQALKIIEIEIEKYLIKCEIILKYYLNKVGLLSDIMGIFQHSNDKYMFKIEFKKYLYTNFNFTDFNNTTNYSSKPELNTLSTNETQFCFNKNNTIYNDLNFNNNIEKNLNILFMNTLKIIIRQDKLNNKYIDKIKSYLNKGDKNYKPSISKEQSSKNKKVSISSFSFPVNNSVITSKSSFHKKKLKTIGNYLLNNMEGFSLEEILKNHLLEEKDNIKYRLMYLQYFILRYIQTIEDCYNKIFNNMDEWIIMNMETQNIKLNEFINYLKRALNKKFDEISLKGREFDYNDKYVKNKKAVLPIYKNLYPNKIMNLNIIFSKGDDFQKNLIKLSDLNFIQQYIYNINDLILLYQSVKDFGLQTCEFFVKYEIVKEILMNYIINQKEYFLFYGDLPKIKTYNKANINNNMNAICKKMKFYSEEKIDNFIKIFCVYDNKYININELFTTLIIIGSELIHPEKFIELIKPHIPEEKLNKKNILLNLDEFMKIPFWFENDKYLNELSDYSEENTFIGDYLPNFSINQINLKKKRHEKFENESKTSSSKRENNNKKNEKKKKIDKIKETIFEINMENNLLDINIIKELLDKLINYCNNKNKNISFNINKEDFDNIDADDKCYRFSADDIDDYFDFDKNETFIKKHSSNQKNIKHQLQIINNIFNNIFEK